MSTTYQLLPAIDACQEIQSDLCHAPVSPEKPCIEPSLAQPAGQTGGCLLLGMADDGLPVLLDLYDPAPGPLLVAGDSGCGKTAMLQSLARLAGLQDPGDIQFGVVTPFPEEWSALENLPDCLGIWPSFHPSARAFLGRLADWAEGLPGTRQAILLLFDGFDLLSGRDLEALHDLRRLLLYGPEHQVWPVVTVNPARLTRLDSWLDYFHTRLLGHVKNNHHARILTDEPQAALADLLPGAQFGLSHSGSWLKFWLPPVDRQGVCHERWNALVR
jgi:hypothetical protein